MNEIQPGQKAGCHRNALCRLCSPVLWAMQLEDLTQLSAKLREVASEIEATGFVQLNGRRTRSSASSADLREAVLELQQAGAALQRACGFALESSELLKLPLELLIEMFSCCTASALSGLHRCNKQLQPLVAEAVPKAAIKAHGTRLACIGHAYMMPLPTSPPWYLKWMDTARSMGKRLASDCNVDDDQFEEEDSDYEGEEGEKSMAPIPSPQPFCSLMQYSIAVLRCAADECISRGADAQSLRCILNMGLKSFKFAEDLGRDWAVSAWLVEQLQPDAVDRFGDAVQRQRVVKRCARYVKDGPSYSYTGDLNVQTALHAATVRVFGRKHPHSIRAAFRLAAACWQGPADRTSLLREAISDAADLGMTDVETLGGHCLLGSVLALTSWCFPEEEEEALAVLTEAIRRRFARTLGMTILVCTCSTWRLFTRWETYTRGGKKSSRHSKRMIRSCVGPALWTCPRSTWNHKPISALSPSYKITITWHCC